MQRDGNALGTGDTHLFLRVIQQTLQTNSPGAVSLGVLVASDFQPATVARSPRKLG